MNSKRTLATAVAFLVVTATALCAQSPQSTDVTATVTIDPFLSVVTANNIDFGSHFASVGVVATSAANFGEVNCTTDPGNAIDVSFALPAVLDRVGGGDPGVPITFGITSARLVDQGVAETSFDPAVGVTGFVISTGTCQLDLGLPNLDPPNDVISVDLTGHASGTYTGTLTVTFAVP